VRDVLLHYLTEEYGNEGSRTHAYGARAKQAVQRARDQVAQLAGARRDEVIFTSGATESNNLALLGLRDAGLAAGKGHVVTTAIEHKAVLEPVDAMEQAGFAVTRLPVGTSGAVDPDDLAAALRPDTWLVSVMHVNNETGVRQPLADIAEALADHPAYLHTDAAQGFGKDIDSLRHPRIDLVSVSGHKLYGPKGVGALIARRRGYERPQLRPLLVGGGQERGLRPGTLPVALIVALGEACSLAEAQHASRADTCWAVRQQALSAFASLPARLIGDQDRVLPHVLNIAFEDLDSEALMVALKDLIAISNGSACTSSSYEPSHVLRAMGLNDNEANRCVRISWCHMTPSVDWGAVAQRIKNLL
jgi:cysteine desulfurase